MVGIGTKAAEALVRVFEKKDLGKGKEAFRIVNSYLSGYAKELARDQVTLLRVLASPMLLDELINILPEGERKTYSRVSECFDTAMIKVVEGKATEKNIIELYNHLHTLLRMKEKVRMMEWFILNYICIVGIWQGAINLKLLPLLERIMDIRRNYRGKSLGDYFHELHQEAGLNETEVGRLLGISHAQIIRMEKSGNFKTEYLDRFFEKLNELQENGDITINDLTDKLYRLYSLTGGVLPPDLPIDDPDRMFTYSKELKSREAVHDTYTLEYESIGKMIEGLRKAKGLNRNELARLSGVNRNTVRSIENDRYRNPSMLTVVKLLNGMQIYDLNIILPIVESSLKEPS